MPSAQPAPRAHPRFPTFRGRPMSIRSLALSGVPALLCLALWSAPAQAQLEAHLVADGFAAPLWLGSPAGDVARLFICEQNTGLVRIIKNGQVLPVPFLDIGAISMGGGERGLLGMTFHPDYASNRQFYVSYSDNSGNSVVRRYEAMANDPDQADPSSWLTIIGPISQPYSNHNGGCLQFGPDGKLYFGLGDGGSGNDPGNRAQNGQQLLGKMLRLNDDGTIPSDNPFVGDPNVLDQIWALGLRNPWRFSFDRLTGDMWIGDVGQNAREEIDFEAVGDGGNNYGWRCMEGLNCTGLSGCTCNSGALTLPVHQYVNPTVGCSVTGGYMYRGALMPNHLGRYFFADWCNGRVWSFAWNGSSISDLVEHTADLAIPGSEAPTSFGEDALGELYMVDASGGQIWRLQAECAGATNNYCQTSPNSAGAGALIASNGDTSVGNNSFQLQGFGCPPNQFALFYYGPNEIQIPFGDGFRCVGGGAYRLIPPLLTDGFGDVSRDVDFTQPPANSGPGQISPGDTWKFQLWYRDPAAGNSGFNLSNGLSADFCP